MNKMIVWEEYDKYHRVVAECGIKKDGDLTLEYNLQSARKPAIHNGFNLWEGNRFYEHYPSWELKKVKKVFTGVIRSQLWVVRNMLVRSVPCWCGAQNGWGYGLEWRFLRHCANWRLNFTSPLPELFLGYVPENAIELEYSGPVYDWDETGIEWQSTIAAQQ